MDVSIQKIIIKIGKKEVELSLEEAKELQEILDKTFGHDTQIIRIPEPYPVYPHPWRYWSVTYNNTDSVDKTIVYCTGINSGN